MLGRGGGCLLRLHRTRAARHGTRPGPALLPWLGQQDLALAKRQVQQHPCCCSCALQNFQQVEIVVGKQ